MTKHNEWIFENPYNLFKNKWRKEWGGGLACFGDLSLIRRNKYIILNSRKPIFPISGDFWIENSKKAAEEVRNLGGVIFTSTGLISWELPLFLSNYFKIPVIVLLPPDRAISFFKTCTKVINDFALYDSFLFLMPASFKNLPDRNTGFTNRDEILLELCDFIFPVSISESGQLSKILNKIPSNKLIWKFKTDKKPLQYFPLWKNFIKSLRNKKDLKSNNLLNNCLNEIGQKNFLIHWTSTIPENNSIFPKSVFYEKLVDDKNSYPLDACNNLKNILDNKTIKASNKVIRGKFSVVSFSELNIIDLINRINWMSHRKRFNFEPYGIAFSKDFLLRFGVRPVIYCDNNTWKNLTKSELPFFQNEGEFKNWIFEKEYRILGDFSFEKTDISHIFVPFKKDVDFMKSKFAGLKFINIFNN